MNYFFMNNGEIIIGVSTTQNVEDIKLYIPSGCAFYFYNEGDDLNSIMANKEPDGIGVGEQIDLSYINPLE